MLTPEKIKALEQIQSAINSKYGFKNGIPSVNMGPCGPFAKAFFEIWNGLFSEKVIICFLFEKGTTKCAHCFLKLPSGDYYDGGNGIVKAESIDKLISPDFVIEEMNEYDEAELDKNAYGLNRAYPQCSTYDHEHTKEVIEKYLSESS